MNFIKIKAWQWILLVIVLLALLDWFIQRPDARSTAFNQIIQSQGSPELKAYPYPFRVLRVEGEMAIMGTPRNVEVPAFKFLGVIHPEINVKNANDPAFIEAEKTLARVQSEARNIVLAQPGIRTVIWELDKKWLVAHHIDVPDQ